jgi:hypothetical protein
VVVVVVDVDTVDTSEFKILQRVFSLLDQHFVT